MNGEDHTTGDRETRIKKLRFRAWHRGMKEMDLILGGFADRHLVELEDNDLDFFERLLRAPDQEFYKVLSGDLPIPPEIDHPIVRRLVEFTQTAQAAPANR